MKIQVILADMKSNYPHSNIMIDVSAPRSTFDKSLSISDDTCILKEHTVRCSTANIECGRFHQGYDIVDMWNEMIGLVCKENNFGYFSSYQMTKMVPLERYDDHLHYDKKSGLSLNVAFKLLMNQK